jgi:hypothetical protein
VRPSFPLISWVHHGIPFKSWEIGNR